jgi:hypothetical protein
MDLLGSVDVRIYGLWDATYSFGLGIDGIMESIVTRRGDDEHRIIPS